MRLKYLVCVLLAAMISPAAAQDQPQSMVQLLEERYKAVRQLADPNCSQLVALSALARIQSADESIRRRFPALAEQFDRTGWPLPPGYEAASAVPDPSATAVKEIGDAVQEDSSPAEESRQNGAGTPPESAPAASAQASPAATYPASLTAEPTVVDYTHEGHYLSYTVSSSAEIMLGTYVPGEAPAGGGYFLFYLKNSSEQPIHVSPRHFQLMDLDYDRSVRIKSPAELRPRFNLMAKIEGALAVLTLGLAGPGNPSTSNYAFRMSESPMAANQAAAAIGAGSASAAGEQIASEARLDEQVARKLEGIYALRPDWRSGSKDFILSDDTILPGQEFIRFVLTEKSNRNHRHLLAFRNGDLSAALQGAEKGLR